MAKGERLSKRQHRNSVYSESGLNGPRAVINWRGWLVVALVFCLAMIAGATLGYHINTRDADVNRALQHLSDTMRSNEAKIDAIRERLP